MSDLIPQRYEDWRHCITRTCGIPLTERYIRERLEALNDGRDHMTVGFVQLYGEAHRRQVLAWFERALEEVA